MLLHFGALSVSSDRSTLLTSRNAHPHHAVWPRTAEAGHQVLLAELRRAGKLDLSRASLDSISVRAKRGGVDRRKSC